MDQTTTTAIQQHPPSNNTKQGFRFHKSGNISPIPPSSSTQPSTTTTQKLSRSNSNTGDIPTSGTGEGRQLQLPSNIDHKLYQIIKRITSNTPSLLVCSSGKSRIYQYSTIYTSHTLHTLSLIYTLSCLTLYILYHTQYSTSQGSNT